MEAAARALDLLGDAECPSISRGLGPGTLSGGELLDASVRVWISGTLAWVESTARYTTGPGATPSTYRLAFPPGARLSRFRAQVAGKVLEGRLQDRSRAMQAYQAVLAKGQPATLTEQSVDSLEINLGAVPPASEVAINLTYVEALQPQSGGDLVFHFPLLDQAGKLPGNFQMVTVLETAGVPPARLAASQPTATQSSQRGDLRIELARPTELKPRDFTLRFRLGAEQPRVQLFAGEQHFHVGILPPKNTVPSPAGVDVVFLLDRSQAMAGANLEGARQALTQALGILGERDRFAIWAYNEQLAGPSGGRLTGPSERPAALEWLKTLAPAGTADLAKVLEQLRAVPGTGRTFWLVLITGSTLPNGGEIIKAAQARPLPGRLYAFSLSGENQVVLSRLSEQCRGHAFQVNADQVKDAVERLIGSLRQPVAFELELQDQGLGLVPESLVPAHLSDLLAQRPVSAAGRKTGQGALSLQLKLPHETAVRTAKIAPFPSKNPALAAGWASLRLARLEEQRQLAAPSDQTGLTQELSEISVQSGVLSLATALVLLDLQNVAHLHVLRDASQPQVTPLTPANLPARPAAETTKLPPLPPLDEKPRVEPAPAPPAPKPLEVRRDRGLTAKTGVNTSNRLTAKSQGGAKKIAEGAKAQFTRQKPPGSDRAKIEGEQAAKIRDKHKDKLDSINKETPEVRRLIQDDSMTRVTGEIDPAFESVWTFGTQAAAVGHVPGRTTVSGAVEPKNLRQQFLERLDGVEQKLDRLRRQPSRTHAEPLAEELYYSLGVLEEACKSYPNLEPMLQSGQDLYRALLNANPAVIDGLQNWIDQWRSMGS
ncbi:hypothetical protein DYH09_07260 [bacterium CPR1]|nr:hypothetical protein [bacterium CPR1]